MRSLFLKIFFSFWATLVIIAIALNVAFSLLQPNQTVSPGQSIIGDAMALYANSAAHIADEHGTNAVAAFLRRAEETTHVRGAVLDADLQPVAGTLRSEEQQLAANAKSSRQPVVLFHSDAAVGAEPVTAVSGKTYIVVVEFPRARFAPPRGGLRQQTIFWGVAILVSGFICYVLTRYLTAPIFRLRVAAGEIAGGNLAARAAPKLANRRDEIGELVRDFNHMSERIELLVRSQQQLIRDISHELRSPLARLNVALGLARQRAGEGATPALDRIERESERLNEMIGRLLTLARVQAAERPPEPESVRLLPLIQQIADDAQFECSTNGCTVQVKARGDCVVEGSRELLRSAIENVVRNAIRYTPERTTIEVSLDCEPQGAGGVRARIAVSDHGAGVPEAELANLFRPFYRVSGARERGSGGTGIGLAITDAVVRLHGGSVQARNAQDGGLVVQLELPNARIPA